MDARSSAHLESGRLAEGSALRFLQEKGLRLLTSNYRCRYGELDLIMTRRETLIIIEIRYRRHTDFMTPAETITRQKRNRIARATLHFLQHNANHRNRPVRFDVLSMSGPITHPTVNWIPGAFTTEDTQVDRYA